MNASKSEKITGVGLDLCDKSVRYRTGVYLV